MDTTTDPLDASLNQLIASAKALALDQACAKCGHGVLIKESPICQHCGVTKAREGK